MKAAEVFGELLCPMDVSCMRCDAEQDMGNGTGLCAGCLQTLSPYALSREEDGVALYAAYLYTGTAVDLIHGLKYENKRYMAYPLIRGLARTVKDHGIEADGIAAVPLHKRRLRERGFNQSALLASGLSRLVGIPYFYDALIRVRDTGQQVGLDEVQRRQNVDGAFACTRDVLGLRIVLVDDVCTTGATLKSCAKVLKEHGANVTFLAASVIERDAF